MRFTTPWSLTVHVEHGPSVLADANFISDTVGGVFSDAVPISRIRIVFGDDESLEYTNHIIGVEEFLAAIPGAILYDEVQKALFSQRDAPADRLRSLLS